MTTQVEAKIVPTQDGNLEAFTVPAGCAVRMKSSNFCVALIVIDKKAKQEHLDAGGTVENWTPVYAKLQPLGKPEEGKPGHHDDTGWAFLEKFDIDDPSTVDAMEEAGHLIRGIDSLETAIIMTELAFAANDAIAQQGGIQA